jgi:hypothetical protein
MIKLKIAYILIKNFLCCLISEFTYLNATESCSASGTLLLKFVSCLATEGPARAKSSSKVETLIL